MFYSFSYTVTTGDLAASPHEIPMHLTAGVIHQVDVVFQDGCDHYINVQMFSGGVQLWPSNRGETLKGNATVISFREFLEIPQGYNQLTAKVWTTDATKLAEVIIQLGVLPKRIIQPLSFEELLAAAAGIET